MFQDALLFFLFALDTYAVTGGEPIVWTSAQQSGETRVHLYFFWSQKCPHCLKALPFIESLDHDHAWLEVHSHEISRRAPAAPRG